MKNGPAFILKELIQNGLDEHATEVTVELRSTSARSRARLVVTDNSPEGFADLRHAWTLYGDSPKRPDASKRGFMDRGEKLVIACCEWAEIRTTTGGVRFDVDGRHALRTRQDVGTTFEAVVKLTQEEVAQALSVARRIIPPAGVRLIVNGDPVPTREPIAIINDVSLDTLLPDEEGVMRRRRRKTTLKIYEPLPGEPARLYELGIPVVRTEDRFDVSVEQRAPVTEDRNNVPPAYLREVRVAVLNGASHLLKPDDAAATWVREALADRNVTEAAARLALALRFGHDAVAGDPNDTEAMKTAASNGVTVVSGGSLSKSEWETARRFKLLPPAGQAFPTAHPEFSNDPQAPLWVIQPENYSPGMARAVALMQRVCEELVNRPIAVKVVNAPITNVNTRFSAWWTRGQGLLTLNVSRLGYKWFEGFDVRPFIQEALHEAAHERVSDHLAHEYHDELCRLGAKLALLVLEQPDLLDLAPANEPVAV